MYEDKCVSGGCHYFEKEIRSQNELDEYIANHAKTGCQGTIECDGFDGSGKSVTRMGRSRFSDYQTTRRARSKKP